MTKYRVKLVANAMVSTSIEVEANTQAEAEEVAVDTAESGNVIWRYDGLLGNGHIEVMRRYRTLCDD